MSNDYFNNTAPLSRNSKARSAEMRSKIDAIAAGFDKLPGKNALEQNAVHYAVATGSANTYAAAMPATLTAYAAGQSFRLQIPATNTGASTLNVDSLGARAIKRLDGTDVEAGDLTSGDIVELIFNGTAMVLMGFYRSHMAGIAANLGADLVFSGNPAFTGAPRFNAATNKSTIRSDLGLTIGTNVQAYNAKLQSLSGLTGAADKLPYLSGTSTFALATLTSFGRSLIDDTNAATARSTLGLGSIATQAADSVNIDGGSMDGTPIGQSTPAAAAVTTLTVTSSGEFGSTVSVASEADGSRYLVKRGGNIVAEMGVRSYDTDGFDIRVPDSAGTGNIVGMSWDWSGGVHYLSLGPGGSEKMRVDGNGNVGFGVSSPTAKVEAETAADTQIGVLLKATSGSYANSAFRAQVTRAANSGYSFFRGYSSGNTDLEVQIRGDGNAFIDGSWTGGGADYAEYFEWALAHLDWLKEWKRQRKTAAGISVVLDTVEAEEVLSSTELRAKVEARVGGDQAAVDAVLARIATGKIHSYLYMFCDESGKARLPGFKLRPATWLDDPEDIIGVISANPSVVGDGDIDRWKDKYLRDAFGAYVLEDYKALNWTEVVTETETVQEQATETQERTRAVIEVVDGQAVRKTVTETVQVPLFDELPLVDEAGDPVMEQVQVGEDEEGAAVFEGRQVIHRAPRMAEVQRQTSREIEHSYAADEVPEGVTVPADAERVTQQRRKLNPDYDPTQIYKPRADRPEWDTVGLMGKLRLIKGQPVGARWIKMRDVSAEVEEWLVR